MTKTTKPASAKSAAKTRRTKSPDNVPQKIRPIQIDLPHQLTEQLRELRLPSFRDHFQEAATQATTENLSHLEFLSALATLECEARRDGRIRRMMTRSRLLYGKTWGTFKFDRLPLRETKRGRQKGRRKKGQVSFFLSLSPQGNIGAMHLHVDGEPGIDPVFLNRSTEMVVTEVDREAVSVEVSR